jgi:hypothetical protein
MSKVKSQPWGRLAMREEGTTWNAYYTMPDTMTGAIWLGGIAMQFVEDESRRKIFLNLMQEAVADLLEEMTGERPTWLASQLAPEFERTKKA